METTMTCGTLSRTLQATCSLEEAAARVWDVLVAGAGPAGALTARGLAQQESTVLLVDKAAYPRWKVCGCCLNGAALASLSVAGLGHLPHRLGASPLRQLRLRAGGREAALPLPAGASLSRRALDAARVEAALQAGAAFLPETEAVLEPATGDYQQIRLCHNLERLSVHARIVVAADGLAGSFLKKVPDMEPTVCSRAPVGLGAVFDDAPEFYAPEAIHMAYARAGYVGAVRLEDGKLDVASALDPRRLRRPDGAAAAVAAILRECGFPCPEGLEAKSFRGTPALTRRRARVAAEGLFVLGDAAAYIEPFTGEGMAWAMQEALLLVPLAKAAMPALWCRARQQTASRPAPRTSPVRLKSSAGRRWACAGHEQGNACTRKRPRFVCDEETVRDTGRLHRLGGAVVYRAAGAYRRSHGLVRIDRQSRGCGDSGRLTSAERLSTAKTDIQIRFGEGPVTKQTPAFPPATRLGSPPGSIHHLWNTLGVAGHDRLVCDHAIRSRPARQP
jgi:menaquinone-9 beta-reductase